MEISQLSSMPWECFLSCWAPLSPSLSYPVLAWHLISTQVCKSLFLFLSLLHRTISIEGFCSHPADCVCESTNRGKQPQMKMCTCKLSLIEIWVSNHACSLRSSSYPMVVVGDEMGNNKATENPPHS